MDKLSGEIKDKEYNKAIANLIYKEIDYQFSLNRELNNDNNNKLAILSEIYKRFSKTMLPKEVEKLKALILGENSYAIYKFNSEKYKGIKDFELITREKSQKVKSIHNEKSRTLIENAFRTFVSVDEIQSIMNPTYSKEMYTAIMQKLLIKFFLDQKRMDVRKFNDTLAQDSFGEILSENEEIEDEFKDLVIEFFSEHFNYIDKQSLLLNSASRIMLGMRMIKGEKIEGLELKGNDEESQETNQEESISFLKAIYEELKRDKEEDFEYKIFINDCDEAIISVNKKIIQDFLSRCTKTDYITDDEIKKIHQEILEGTLTDDLEKRKIANVNIQDLLITSKSYDSKGYNEKENKSRILSCCLELASYLKSIGEITSKGLLDLYLQGKLNFEIISSINMSEIPEEYWNSELKQIYGEMVFLKEDIEKSDKLNRYSALYRNLSEIGQINIDIDKLTGDIIDFFGADFAPEVLEDLYELKLVTLEKAVEWVGTDILARQYERGKLKPAKAREFYENGIIDLDGMAYMIKKLSDNGQKFMVIGSIFPEENEEERDIRDLLIDECLEIDAEINSEKGNKRKKGEEKEKDYYKHITDPFSRISLIKSLDKDYSFEMTIDGHAIVQLPNLRKVIIEKMLDKNRQPSYGSATYILDEDYYNLNNTRIKIDGKICRQEIIKDINSKSVTRIIHATDSWGKSIKEYFGIEENSKYSEEDINNINEAIERVKRSVRIIGE